MAPTSGKSMFIKAQDAGKQRAQNLIAIIKYNSQQSIPRGCTDLINMNSLFELFKAQILSESDMGFFFQVSHIGQLTTLPQDEK